MKSTLVLILIISVFGLSSTQANGPTGAVNTGANSGGASGGTNTGNSGTNTNTNNNDGTQGYNQGYSYNTGIRPYQTGFTFYQPFGDEANKQNGNTGTQNTGSAAPVAAQPAAPAAPAPAPAGYQPGFNVFSPQNAPVSGQPVQYQNVPQFVHYGPPPPVQGGQAPVQVQPINLANFDGGLPLLDSLGLGGGGQNNNRRNNQARQAIPSVGGNDDFDLGNLVGIVNNNNNNRNSNPGFFAPPATDNAFFPQASNGGGGSFFGNNNNNNNNNNGYDNLPDDQSLANFANLGGGGGGQSNDYPDNDFLGGFGSATNNRDTFDIPVLGDGFFRR